MEFIELVWTSPLQQEMPYWSLHAGESIRRSQKQVLQIHPDYDRLGIRFPHDTYKKVGKKLFASSAFR